MIVHHLKQRSSGSSRCPSYLSSEAAEEAHGRLHARSEPRVRIHRGDVTAGGREKRERWRGDRRRRGKRRGWRVEIMADNRRQEERNRLKGNSFSFQRERRGRGGREGEVRERWMINAVVLS